MANYPTLEELWKVMKDSISEGFIICDMNLCVVDVNKNLEIMLGIDNCEKKGILDVLPKRVLYAVEDVLQQIRDLGFCMLPKRINLITPKGVVLPLLVTGEILSNDLGEKLGYLFLFRDAIVQSEISSISWANAVKTMQLGRIAQQIYLPLHEIDRCLDGIKEGMDDVELCVQLIGEMATNLQSLWGAYDVLLKLPQIDEVCKPLDLRRIDFHEMLNRIFSLIGLNCAIDVQGDSFIVSDEFKLEQFLSFLLDFLFAGEYKGKNNMEYLFTMVGRDKDVSLQITCSRSKDFSKWKEIVDYLSPKEEFPYDWDETKSLDQILMRWLLVTLSIGVELSENLSNEIIFRLSVPREI